MSLAIYPIPGPWKGQLAILARPRGGEWLEDEIRGWRNAGIEMVVSLLELAEQDELGLVEEGPLAESHDIGFVSFPILDRAVPQSLSAVAALLAKVREALDNGKAVGVHCRQGIGRSSLIAGGVLIVSGVEPRTALETVARARGVPVPDTPEQRAWLENTLVEHLALAKTNR
jgi:protein-tyrosine phosphatase